MTPVFEYVHSIKGRLRIKVIEVRRSPVRARELESLFRGIDGVREVEANPITGNVLFLYDPERIAAREIMAGLIAAGYMGMDSAGAPQRLDARPQFAVSLLQVVAQTLSLALEGLSLRQDLVETLVMEGIRFLFKLILGRAAVALT